MIALIVTAALLAQPGDIITIIARKARENQLAVAKDQFASVPSFKEEIGRPFTAVITESEDAAFSERYADGKLFMSISTFPFYNHGSGSSGSVKGFNTSTNTVPLKQYVGQNSFGATFTITEADRSEIAVVGLESPRGENAVSNPGFSQFDYYSVSKELEGPAAKLLFSGAKAVIEGTLTTFSDGKVAVCDDKKVEPTASIPLSETIHACRVAANITRLAIYGGDGSLVKEWK